MATTIQIRRGSKANLPSLASGEFGLATDTSELYIGGASGNLQTAILDSSGKLQSSQLPQIEIPRTCRFVIGTSTNGWTANDCDYLCDGTADDVEINAAIQALPSTGGEVFILDGTYYITTAIAINKNNVSLTGNGSATILKRMWGSTSNQGVIDLTASTGQCSISNFQIDGNSTSFSSTNNWGIYVSNTINNSIKYIYLTNCVMDVRLNSADYCNVSDIFSSSNSQYFIYLYQSNNNQISHNSIQSNSSNSNGIYISNSFENIIDGNLLNPNSGGRGINESVTVGTNLQNGNVFINNIINNYNYGIYIITYESGGNSFIGNKINNSTTAAIYKSNGSYDVFYGNSCFNSGQYGFTGNGFTWDLISSNYCWNSGVSGFDGSYYSCIIAGNMSIRGYGSSSNYTDSQYTMNVGGNNSLFIGNGIFGKNYVDSGSNTWVNNIVGG